MLNLVGKPRTGITGAGRRSKPDENDRVVGPDRHLPHGGAVVEVVSKIFRTFFGAGLTRKLVRESI